MDVKRFARDAAGVVRLVGVYEYMISNMARVISAFRVIATHGLLLHVVVCNFQM